MSSKFIKKYSILYTIYKGEVGQDQQKVKSNTVGKENTGYLRYGCLQNW